MNLLNRGQRVWLKQDHSVGLPGPVAVVTFGSD